jgi:hypothetical protein
MAYIGATELSGLLPNAVPTLTGSSRPLNIAEVATICERVSVELDTAAAIAGYLTPIPTTATQAFGQMALYNSWGAACRTLQIIFPGGGQSAEMPLAQDYCNDFRNVLDRIRASAEILVGAPTDPSETSRSLARSLSVTGDPTATSGVQAQSQVGMKF